MKLRTMATRRTKEQILDALKEFIKNKLREEEYEFFKSDVASSKAKVHPETSGEFFKLIEKAQKDFPLIEVREISGTTLIRILSESETLISAIDTLIAKIVLSKDATAELIELRTQLKAKNHME